MDESNKPQSEQEISDEVGARGFFLVETIRDTGKGPEVIRRVTAPNLIVNTGKRQTWRQACGLNTNDWDQGRIGINSAAAGSADTNVKTAITGTINTVDSKTLLSGTRTLQLVWSYPSGAGTKSATVKEIAILNQNTSPGGSALARAVLSPVAAKTTADKLKITYRCRIT